MFQMPILPLFSANNTFQGSNRVVKRGRKELREERSREQGQNSKRGVIAKGNGYY